MKGATTIFYTNSFGILCQWKGVVIARDENSISIRFSKNKAYKYDLKGLDIQFVLITKTLVKSQLPADQQCFDENLQGRILESNKGNVSMLWQNRKWEIA